MAIKKIKSYLYTRISSLQQQAGYGIERQINTVMDFLSEASLPAGLGYELDPNDYELLESDLGKSAYKGHNFTKGELGRFKEKVVKGEITEGILLIENVDRFSRLPDYEAIEHFNALIKRGIDVLEVESGQVFSTKLDGTLSKLAVSIERSHQESKRKARLTTRNWEKMKRNALETGKALKNNCPNWLSIRNEQYEVDEGMVAIMKVAFERFAEGYSAASVVRFMNDSNQLINDRKWNTMSIYHMFRNRRLIGYIDKVKYYPAVIELELFNRVQSMIGSSNKRQKTTQHQRSIFNGITKCALCGSGMIVHSTGKGILYLRCIGERSQNGCKNGLIRYPVVERILLNHINKLDLSRIYSSGNDVSVIGELHNKLASLNHSIQEYQSELEGADDIVVLQLARVLKKLNTERDELASKIAGHNLTSYEKVDYDIESIVNQENWELRQKANIELKKIIKQIQVQRRGDEKVLYLINIQYYTDILKHVLIMNNSGSLISEITITEKENERIYQVREDGETVFKVESDGDAWVLNASRTKKIDDLLTYISVMMVGREPEGFVYQLNEDQIEWID